MWGSKWPALASVGLALATLCYAGSMNAQEDAAACLSREQGETILNELRELKALLQGGGAALVRPAVSDTASVNVNGALSLGKADAPVVMVEFVDFQCGFCRKFHLSTFDILRSRYIDTGKLRFVLKNLPLSFHRHAHGSAIAARCAADVGGSIAYWRLVDALFLNQRNLSAPVVERLVEEIGVDQIRFGACVNDPRIAALVAKDVEEAARAGITGTPGFVVGTAIGDVVTGVRIRGAQPDAVYTAKIDGLLKSVK